MNSDKLVDRLESYSNAILAFVVAQSVTFAFTFGVQSKFSCAVIADKILATGLLAHFVVSTVLAILSMQYLSRVMRRLSPVNHGIVRNIFFAKSVIVAIFTMIPIFLLYSYGVGAEPGTGRCARSDQAAIAPLRSVVSLTGPVVRPYQCPAGPVSGGTPISRASCPTQAS